MCLEMFSEPLRSLAELSRESVSEHVRLSPGPFQRLRGDAQAVHVAEARGLGFAGVVSIEIGGRIGGEEMQLESTAATSATCGKVSPADERPNPKRRCKSKTASS